MIRFVNLSISHYLSGKIPVLQINLANSFFLGILFSLFTAYLSAQNQQSRDSIKIQELRPVTVTASRIEGDLQQLPYAISVYFKKESDDSKQQLSLKE